jgi:hypothetical protein
MAPLPQGMAARIELQDERWGWGKTFAYYRNMHIFCANKVDPHNNKHCYGLFFVGPKKIHPVGAELFSARPNRTIDANGFFEFLQVPGNKTPSKAPIRPR